MTMQPAFFVTAIDGPRVYLLAGPYASKAIAESAVPVARAIACDHARNASAGRAHFMAYGASRWKDETRNPPATILGPVMPET